MQVHVALIKPASFVSGLEDLRCFFRIFFGEPNSDVADENVALKLFVTYYYYLLFKTLLHKY